MYYQLTESIKRRIILELRKYWQHHPKYPELVNNIQGKYSFEERPQYGIVVKISGGSRVDMSADNYRGIVKSYCYLTKVNNKPGFSIEWVREDSVAIQKNNGLFPSQAGIYYIDLSEDNIFYVDPLLDYRDEILQQSTTTQFTFAHKPLQNTVRVYDMPSQIMLFEGKDYTIDYDTKTLTTVSDIDSGRYLVADYRHPATSKGPFTIIENRSNTTAIPGVVLAFGRMCQKGDQLAVVVSEKRELSALEYGGRWEINLDCDIMARDVYAQQELTDRTLVYLWGIVRSRLSTQGLEMKDLSFGGESEEIYDDVGDEYYYNANFSMTIESEWGVHIPLVTMIRRNSGVSLEKSREISQLSDEDVAKMRSDIEMLEGLGLEMAEDPFFRNLTQNFEKIT